MWNVETSKNYWYWINEKYLPIYEDFHNKFSVHKFSLHVEKERDNKYTLIITIRGKVIDTSELIFEDEETISKYENKVELDILVNSIIKEQLTIQVSEKRDSILIIPEKIYISHLKNLCFENIWVYKYKWARWTKVKVNTIKGKYFVLWEWDMIEDSAVDYWSFSHNIFMDVETKEKFIIKDSVFVKIWISKSSWEEKFLFTEKDIQEHENLLCPKYNANWNFSLNKFWLSTRIVWFEVISNKIFISLFNLC